MGKKASCCVTNYGTVCLVDVTFVFRCIKPNDKKAAHIFNEALVCHQVRYLGLLENVRVRRAGYAFRQPYEPCLERYKMLCKQTWPHWRGPARY